MSVHALVVILFLPPLIFFGIGRYRKKMRKITYHANIIEFWRKSIKAVKDHFWSMFLI